MEELIKEISSKVYKHLFAEKPIKELWEELLQIPPKPFLVYEFRYGEVDYTHWFLLNSVDYWKELSFEDWKAMLRDINDKASALYSFFIFTYVYLRIDFISVYARMQDVNEGDKKLDLTRYKSQPDIFMTRQTDLNVLESIGLSFDDLWVISEKLIAEGAPVAEEIAKPKKVDNNYVFEVPKSWTWAN